MKTARPLSLFLKILKAQREALHGFHRERGPFSGISRWIGTFSSWPFRKKSVFLLAATMLIGFRIHQLLFNIMLPLIKRSVTDRYPMRQIQCLIYFDILVYMGVAAVFLFIVFMICGNPGSAENSFFIRRLRGHPLIVFLLTVPLSVLFLLAVPTIITDFLLRFAPHLYIYHHLPPVNSFYLEASLVFGFSIGLSMADSAADPKAVRWWTIPFFLIPLPLTNQFPLLWWNAVAGLFPSRYWSPWKPFLGMLSVLLFLAVYPMSMQIKEHLPVYHPKALDYQDVLCNTKSYLVKRVPNSSEAFIRCGEEHLVKIRRDADGWRRIGDLDLGFHFDHAGFNYKNDFAILYNSIRNALYKVRLSDLTVTQIADIAPDLFNTNGDTGALVEYDPELKHLAVGSGGGALGLFDGENLSLLASYHLLRGIRADFFLDPFHHRLFFLQVRSMFIFDMNDLRLIKALNNLNRTNIASGIIDEKRSRYLFSLPEEMSVAAYSIDDLAPKGKWPAPVGLRVFAIDEKRDWLFLGCFSGVVEIRRLSDMSLVSRVRLIPWIHYMAVFPETAEIIVTSGDIPPMIWRYDPPDTYIDPVDWIFSRLDGVLSYAVEKYYLPSK